MWIAKEDNGSLSLHLEKPSKSCGEWSSTGYSHMRIGPQNEVFETFRDLKWEDEPIEVELVKCKVENKPYDISSLKNAGKYFEVENCCPPQDRMNFYLSKTTYTEEYYSVIRAFVEKDFVIIRFEYKLPDEDRLGLGVAYIDCIATLDEVWNNDFKKIYVDSKR